VTLRIDNYTFGSGQLIEVGFVVGGQAITAAAVKAMAAAKR
jgi:hypothetical protein